MLNDLDKFNGLWDSFLTALKGALLTASKENQLDYNNAQATLTRIGMCWQNDFASEGRWVNQLVQEDEAKGKLVRKILVKDLKFNQQPTPTGSHTPLAIGAIGGGALGYGVAALANMETLGTVATTVATVAIGGIVGNNIASKKKDAAIKASVEGYLTQLDTYYHSVVAALNA